MPSSAINGPGGGYASDLTVAKFKTCQWLSNTASTGGGGASLVDSNFDTQHSVFSYNTADQGHDPSLPFTHSCTNEDPNQRHEIGGAIYAVGSARVTTVGFLLYDQIIFNKAREGAGVYQYTVLLINTLRKCIMDA
jgi:hypothetical protein